MGGKIDAGTGPLANMSAKLNRQTNKPRKLILGQMTEALRTGGVGAKIPMIQQAVSRSNQATSAGIAQTAEQLASRNIGGPFAQRIMAGQRLAGNQQAAAIPTEMAQQLIQQFTPFLASTQSLAASGMSQVAQLGQAADMFSAGSIPFSRTGQTGLLGGICLHPDAKIETPDGAKRVADLKVGDTVWSESMRGGRIPATVIETVTRTVGRYHKMLKIYGPGGEFIVSPDHPLSNGEPIAHRVCGIPVASGEVGTEATCDIAVDGPTGVYFVCGFPLGSTLDARHKSRAKVA